MSEQTYVLQTLLIAGLLLVLCWRESVLLRVQILVWSIGVVGLAIRFGLTSQLDFYSNDQNFYSNVVAKLSVQQFPTDFDWWTSSAKIPYTLPASILSTLGIDPSLALKALSLVCLLILTRHVIKTQVPTLAGAISSVFITACGGIGVFYSLLALRETMMMLLVTRFVTTSSPTTRAFMILLIFLLRPHLAAALVVAAVIILLWDQLQLRYLPSGLGLLGIAVLGCIIGSLLFSFGLWFQGSSFSANAGRWGIDSATRIVSNFVGLQFLTARSETVEFSIRSLLVFRIVFSETIIIPTLFTAMLLVRPQLANTQSRLVLLSFSIYVGLVTNTDFNSFRQNIPFMAVMGLVILHHLKRSPTRDSVGTSN